MFSSNDDGGLLTSAALSAGPVHFFSDGREARLEDAASGVRMCWVAADVEVTIDLILRAYPVLPFCSQLVIRYPTTPVEVESRNPMPRFSRGWGTCSQEKVESSSRREAQGLNSSLRILQGSELMEESCGFSTARDVTNGAPGIFGIPDGKFP